MHQAFCFGLQPLFFWYIRAARNWLKKLEKVSLKSALMNFVKRANVILVIAALEVTEDE